MSYYGQATFEEKYENKHLDGKGINVNPCKKNIWAKIPVSPLSFKPQCPHLNDLLFCFSHPLFSRLLFPLLDCSASDYWQPPPPPLPSREAAIAPPSPSRCSLPFVHHQLWVAIPDLVWGGPTIATTLDMTSPRCLLPRRRHCGSRDLRPSWSSYHHSVAIKPWSSQGAWRNAQMKLLIWLSSILIAITIIIGI